MKLQKVIVGFIGIVASVIIGVSTCVCSSLLFVSISQDVSIIPAFESATTSKYAVRVNCEDAMMWTATADIQFLLTPDMGAAGYAMALTAMATDKKVCFIAQAKTTNSLLTKLSITN